MSNYCALPGHKQCPVVSISGEISVLQSRYEELGSQIRVTNDPTKLKGMAESASELKRQIDNLEFRKNSFNRCWNCKEG